MQVWQAILLGFLQGLTEFLPVSSSGHLELVKALLGIELGQCNVFFDIVLHFGTLIAVVAVYQKKIVAIIKNPKERFFPLVIATIPAGIVGFFLGDILEKYLLNGFSCGCFFLVTALLLLFTEGRAKKAPIFTRVNEGKAFVMGLAQAAAVLPGLSRSGTTIVAGVLIGGEREEVADFSFLMSIPVIGGALFVKIVKLLTDKAELFQTINAFGNAQNMAACLSLGALSALLVGILSVKLLLSSVKKARLRGYAAYLVPVAFLSFFLYFTGKFV